MMVTSAGHAGRETAVGLRIHAGVGRAVARWFAAVAAGWEAAVAASEGGWGSQA
ncbi:hypothetical protein ACFTSF_01905 [Kribbella sp. NPDC056951]|uniref:hypothetical protein n=1 Tax=Kribbella sp. NPDC056951 TaxID=3345978 RepID=UPI003628ED78